MYAVKLTSVVCGVQNAVASPKQATIVTDCTLCLLFSSGPRTIGSKTNYLVGLDYKWCDVFCQSSRRKMSNQSTLYMPR